jgi:phosphoglycolate phosphatase-like HAD superfamily hydrolase
MAIVVFLDFDGVICDSAPECLASSWEAYSSVPYRSLAPEERDRLSAGFLRLRPYVRSGEDFMICQEALDRGLEIGSQEDFDALTSNRGIAEMARLRERFYESREALLRRNRAHWIELNPLYPGVVEHLPRWAGSSRFHVLSTKRSEFIIEILAAAGIAMPAHRVLHAARTEKGVRIAEVLERSNCASALLVDDQIDHLLAIRADSPGVAVYLAAWGYVKPEWLAGPPVPVLPLADLRELVDRALR